MQESYLNLVFASSPFFKRCCKSRLLILLSAFRLKLKGVRRRRASADLPKTFVVRVVS